DVLTFILQIRMRTTSAICDNWYYIYFICVFGILMFPFIETHSLDGWMSMIMCFLTLSIQVSLIVVYFNHKKG
ncbi:hypothetical protein, partial [Thomasclavelia cocleata]|uniref:hypothetical protein n=1 Tax=Thomasclavelia cocleata TaxID=69824 RepID=UPI00242E7D5A